MASFKYLLFILALTSCTHAPRKLTCLPLPHYSKAEDHRLRAEHIRAGNTEPETDNYLEAWGKYRRDCRDFGR